MEAGRVRGHGARAHGHGTLAEGRMRKEVSEEKRRGLRDEARGLPLRCLRQDGNIEGRGGAREGTLWPKERKMKEAVGRIEAMAAPGHRRTRCCRVAGGGWG